MSAVRPLARLAWRDVRRRPLRTALIALIIAIPTAAILAINLVMSTNALTTQQQAALTMGRAHQLVSIFDSEEVEIPGAAVVVERRAAVAVDQGGEFQRVEVRSGSVLDPLLTGKYELLTGRAPTTTRRSWFHLHSNARGEWALATNSALGPDSQKHLVVGIAEDRGGFKASAVYVTSASTVGFREFTEAYFAQRTALPFHPTYGIQYADDPSSSNVGVTERALIRSPCSWS